MSDVGVTKSTNVDAFLDKTTSKAWYEHKTADMAKVEDGTKDADRSKAACETPNLYEVAASHWRVHKIKMKDKPTFRYVFTRRPVCMHTADAPIYSLFEGMIKEKRMVNFRGTLLMYWKDMGQWFHLNSPSAARMVSLLIGAQNATVNFADAVAPYVPYLESACELVGMNLEPSVCINNIRFKVEIEGKYLSLSPYPALYDGPDPLSSTVASKCVSLPMIMSRVDTTVKSKARQYIESLLGDKHTDLLMYAIGCAHVDPVTASYLVMLFDPVGGKGKSTLLEFIKTMLTDSVGYADKDEIGGRSVHMSPTMAKLVGKYRIVITQDVEFETETINSKYIKSLITIDSKRTDVGEIPNGVVHLVGTNNLPYFVGKDMTAARFRRMIVIPYKPNIESKRRGWDRPTFSDADRYKFLAECMHLSETNNSPPFTTEALLYTMFGSLAGKKVRGMSICEDHISVEDSLVATEVIRLVSRTKPEFITEILAKYATSAAIVHEGKYSIKGLIPHKVEIVHPGKYSLSCTLKGMPSVWNFGVHPALTEVKPPAWFVNECKVNGKWAHKIVVGAMNEIEFRHSSWRPSEIRALDKRKGGDRSDRKHTHQDEDVTGCEGLVSD